MSAERKTERYEPGEKIISEGDVGSTVYVLLSGELSVWRGETELARLTGPGDVIGELAALTGSPRAATVIAASQSELLAIDFDPRKLFKTHPDILEKIDRAIGNRYEIARNKARLYVEATAVARRNILQNVIVLKELAGSAKMKDGEDTQVRRKVRTMIEETLDLHGAPDDPRLIRQLADENGVFDAYTSRLASAPWLDHKLVERIRELEDNYALSTRSDLVSTIKDRAVITVEMLSVLGQYESLPGIRHQLDTQRLEKIVPFASRVEALKRISLKKHSISNPNMSDRDRLYFERKVFTVVEKEKINAGTDSVFLIDAARELDISAEYEEELGKLVRVSDMDSTFVDLAAV